MINEPTQTHKQHTPQHTFEEDTISLMDILLILAKHFKLIIITPTLFCIIAIINTLFYPSPIYVSTAHFISTGDGGQYQMMGLAAELGFSMPKHEASQWSYIDVIKSRTLARSLLNRKFDTEKYGSQKTLLQILTYGNKEPSSGIDTLFIDGIDAVQGMIEINKYKNMYELEISAFEPQLAADVANAVMEELDRHQQEYNARNTAKTRQFIEDRLVDVKIEMETAEEFLKEFREQNRSIEESPQLQLEQERLARDVAVLIGVFTTLKQQLVTAKIDEIKKSDYVVMLDGPEIPIHPVESKKRIMVILAGILGIGMGMLLAFIKEYFLKSDKEEQGKMSEAKLLMIKNITYFIPQRFKRV